jgi:hypothetical protein
MEYLNVAEKSTFNVGALTTKGALTVGVKIPEFNIVFTHVGDLSFITLSKNTNVDPIFTVLFLPKLI